MPIDCTARVFADLDLPSAETLVPSWGGRTGHPVRLGASALDALTASDAPLDRVLATCELRHVPVDDEGILSNLNRPADWERLAGGPPTVFSRD